MALWTCLLTVSPTRIHAPWCALSLSPARYPEPTAEAAHACAPVPEDTALIVQSPWLANCLFPSWVEGTRLPHLMLVYLVTGRWGGTADEQAGGPERRRGDRGAEWCTFLRREVAPGLSNKGAVPTAGPGGIQPLCARLCPPGQAA